MDQSDNDNINDEIVQKNYHYIQNLTYRKIHRTIYQIIGELQLSTHKQTYFIHKLNGYRYLNNSNEFKSGSSIKWISLTNPDNIILSTGAILCKLVNIDSNDPTIICKRIYGNHFTLHLNEILIFQKISYQEHVLLYTIDHIGHI